MAEILSPSLLRAVSTGQTYWHDHMHINFTRLNDLLLNLSALGDVDTAGIKDGDLLTYNEVSGKWVAWTPPD